MWKAFENIKSNVKVGGKLVIAVYNDQGIWSSLWKIVKKFYNITPKYIRFIVIIPVFLRFWILPFIRDFLKFKPFLTWKSYKIKHGMSPWFDVIDWVGGYPFEVAKPKDIIDFFEKKGFKLQQLQDCGAGHGNNEFVFINDNGNAQ